MAASKRQSEPSVADRLKNEYYSFSFFKAVELLESMAPGKKKLGQALVPSEEAVRFSATPSLVFPPSEISALDIEDDGGPAAMEVAFLGLVGPSGVLPYWYTELVQEQHREKNDGLKAFLDTFHHRFISLFFLAWKKHKFPANYLEGARDHLSSNLLSLIGLGTEGLSGRIGLPVDSLAFYSGHLSRTVPSALSIESAVAHFAGTEATVEQFVERVLPLEPDDRTALGKANGNLGVNTIVGSEVRECQTKFRVALGPLTYVEMMRFLPCGDMLGPIFSLVKYMVGIEYEFEIRLVLKKEEIPPCIIGGRTLGSPRLGWTTWAKDPQTPAAADPFITFTESDIDVN